MKKLFFLLLVCLFTHVAGAQKNVSAPTVSLPIDSVTRLITYEGVIEVKGVAADDLYRRMQQWFGSFYKNPGEVVRENDSVKYKMMGKPRFRISNPPDKSGLKTDAGIVQYTIQVAAKEGRFRYEITEYNWKQLSYYPCERWMDTKSQSWVPAYNAYMEQLDKYTKDLINNLHQELSHAKPVKDRDDW
jgi:hypothetical protein